MSPARFIRLSGARAFALMWLLPPVMMAVFCARSSLVFASPPVTLTPPLTLTRFGEIKPAGWMLRQLQLDLSDGLAGHYPDISDTVNMREFVVQEAEMTDAAGEPGWWLGEHEGYYADGLFRLSWLAGNATTKSVAIARMQAALTAQDSAGYIGVYSPGTRFTEQDPNDGELWSQSRMYQALLAWYEATGDSTILASVEKAAKLTLSEYTYRSYFGRIGGTGGGVQHGIGFADTLEWLYRITGDDTFRQGYLWLYSDYVTNNVGTDDLTPDHLIDVTRPWYSHTPHIAEGLAVPAIAYAFGGPTQYGQAADEVLPKLLRHSNPGGGPVGDEFVDGRDGTFELNSEYCSMTETIASLNRVAQFRDAMATGDISERIALNAAQGARTHTAATAVSYLTSDNRLSAIQTVGYGDRLIYSASHQAAACCTLNSTRLLPYYIEGMWLKKTSSAGLVARLYGASTLDTTVGGTAVQIDEATDFPFSDKITFNVAPAIDKIFSLSLRIPAYAPNASISVPAGMTVSQTSDLFEIDGTWPATGALVTLDLAFDVRTVQDVNGESAFAYGPLMYALPVDAIATPGRVTRTANAPSTPVFQDVSYTPANTPPNYAVSKNAVFAPVTLAGGDALDPWNKPPTGLSGTLLSSDGSHVGVTLQPIGSTLLRVAGFQVDEIFADPFDR